LKCLEFSPWDDLLRGLYGFVDSYGSIAWRRLGTTHSCHILKNICLSSSHGDHSKTPVSSTGISLKNGWETERLLKM